MSKQTIVYTLSYFVLFSFDFILFHLPGNMEEGGILNGNPNVLLYWLLAYLVYLVTTPFFFSKIAMTTYANGILMMLAGMAFAGLCIWLGFGNGNYSSDFYEYEFVAAGLWFGFVNGALMLFIRFWKKYSTGHGQ